MKYSLLLGLGLCAALPACVVETNDNGTGEPRPVAADSGALVVDWTIDGVKDSNQCDQSAATTIDITVTEANGAPAGEYQQSCRAFATTIDLARGSYSAEAVLLDGGGSDRTTAVHIHSFDILGGDQLTVPIDFAASSFYAP